MVGFRWSESDNNNGWSRDDQPFVCWKREVTMAPTLRNSRFMLWIDAVGGYLVCLSDRVVIGQAAPGQPVDVAIQGDLSRRHAVVSRHGEGYVIEPVQPVRMGGRALSGPVYLNDGDEFQCGGSVRLRFRQPHVLSGSARLEIISGHRTLPRVDGVLLMAESCVLGPAPSNHVVCRNWRSDLVLFRRDEQVLCRSSQPFEVDGRPGSGAVALGGNTRLVGEDFSLSVEHLA